MPRGAQGGDMNNPTEERIAEAAKLMAERDKAIAAIARWQQKLNDSNASLAAMFSTDPIVVQNTEPIQEYVTEQV